MKLKKDFETMGRSISKGWHVSMYFFFTILKWIPQIMKLIEYPRIKSNICILSEKVTIYYCAIFFCKYTETHKVMHIEMVHKHTVRTSLSLVLFSSSSTVAADFAVATIPPEIMALLPVALTLAA